MKLDVCKSEDYVPEKASREWRRGSERAKHYIGDIARQVIGLKISGDLRNLGRFHGVKSIA